MHGSENSQALSAEKAAEQRILELNATLEGRVVERTAKLQAAVRELEDFSYLASHDLSTPLRAIDGFSTLLLRELADGTPSVRDHLLRVRAAAQQMGRIIDDMLVLSRLSRTELNREDLDLTEMAESIVRRLRAASADRLVEVLIQPGLAARGDAGLVRTVLTQLFDNAWKFTLATPSARIEFGREPDGEAAGFFVKDNGAGFDMAYAGKLFKAFQRLHAVEEFPGSGIGLAMVQRIVRKHGGEVRAEGRPGEGATFHFTLPA